MLIKLVLLWTLLVGVNVAALAQCGLDRYKPVVSYITERGQMRKTVRRPRTEYEGYASYQFDQDKPQFLGFHSSKVDEFGEIRGCGVQDRFDRGAIEARNRPGSQIYIVVYGNSGKPKDQLTKRAFASYGKDYLRFARGFDESEVTTTNGGEADSFRTEIWVGPRLSYNTSDIVELPSSSYRSYDGKYSTISLPANWRRLDYLGIVTFAPVGSFKGPGVFSHGVEIIESYDSGAFDEKATGRFTIPAERPANSSPEKLTIAGREAIVETFYYTAPGTKMIQKVVIYKIRGPAIKNPPSYFPTDPYSIVCIITAAPMYEYPSYQATFDQILQSVRFPK